MTYQQTFSKKISSTSIKKQETADFLIENPLAKDIYVSTIHCLLDTHFSAFGIITIEINGIQILKSNPVGSFIKSKTLSIPLSNQILKRNDKVEIFIWSGQEGKTVSLTAYVSISDDPNSNVIPDVPLSTDELNREISDSFIDSQTQHTIDSLNQMIYAINHQQIQINETSIVNELEKLRSTITSQNINHVSIIDMLTELQTLVDSNSVPSILEEKLNTIFYIMSGLPSNTNSVLENISIVKSMLSDGTISNNVIYGELQNLYLKIQLVPNLDPEILKKLELIMSAYASYDNELTIEILQEINENTTNEEVLYQMSLLESNIRSFTQNIHILNAIRNTKTYLLGITPPITTENIAILDRVINAYETPDPDAVLISDKLEELHQTITDFPSDRTDLLHILADLKSLVSSSPYAVTTITQKINEAISILNILSTRHTTNADLLSEIKSNIDSGNLNTSNMLASIDSLLAQTDFNDTETIAQLEQIKLGLQEIDNTSINIPEIIDFLDAEATVTTNNDYKNQLLDVQQKLNELKNGWDVDEIADAITILHTNSQSIKSINNKLGKSLESLLISLEQISLTSNLNKSDNTFIFDPRIYRDTTLTNLINTKGHRNLIFLIPNSGIIDPSTLLIQADSTPVHYNYNGFLTGLQTDLIKSSIHIYDFHHPEVTTRTYNLKPNSDDSDYVLRGNCDEWTPSFQNPPRGGTVTTYVYSLQATYNRRFDVFESDSGNTDDILNGNANLTQLLDNATKSQLNSIVGSKRYLYIIEVMYVTISSHIDAQHTITLSSGQTWSNANICPQRAIGDYIMIPTTFNPTDDALTGGDLALSFEVKGGDGDWYEYIPASDIGTINEGTKKVIKIGENVSGHVLPSTQTDFRIKMKVTGSVKTAISMMRVA